MKTIFIFLIFLFLCTGCENKNNSNKLNIENKPVAIYLIEESTTNNTSTFQEHTTTKDTIGKELPTLQEQIENYSEELVLLFQVEGNFTNSGNKEILAFYESSYVHYERKPEQRSIYKTYCFIYDESNQTIIKTIELLYGTLFFSGFLEEFPLEALGREIRWQDNRFGYIGDFNGNGKEELYFFEVPSHGGYPFFLEFDETGFKEIMEGRPNLFFMDITNVDAVNKIITFETKKGVKPSKVRSFIWNIDSQFYEEIED